MGHLDHVEKHLGSSGKTQGRLCAAIWDIWETSARPWADLGLGRACWISVVRFASQVGTQMPWDVCRVRPYDPNSRSCLKLNWGARERQGRRSSLQPHSMSARSNIISIRKNSVASNHSVGTRFVMSLGVRIIVICRTGASSEFQAFPANQTSLSLTTETYHKIRF